MEKVHFEQEELYSRSRYYNSYDRRNERRNTFHTNIEPREVVVPVLTVEPELQLQLQLEEARPRPRRVEVSQSRPTVSVPAQSRSAVPASLTSTSTEVKPQEESPVSIPFEKLLENLPINSSVCRSPTNLVVNANDNSSSDISGSVKKTLPEVGIVQIQTAAIACENLNPNPNSIAENESDG
jgi:hypothetical protein